MDTLPLTASFGALGPVCRLGLAGHMNGQLDPADIHGALDQGVNFLNWPVRRIISVRRLPSWDRAAVR